MPDINKYKKLLEEEKKRLEIELGDVAEKDPDNPGDWVPTPPPNIEHETDPVDAADAIEEYNERVGIEGPLEERLRDVNNALVAISKGTYGTCTTGDTEHDIEPGRLEANPAAMTCIAHMT
ncbi:MAG TPA: hypothetical protein VJK09_01955 [Candidatus Paceibacterota bacterium]